MNDRELMGAALEQARFAMRVGEIPIGAVVVHDGRIVAAAHNRRELDQDPAGHAELLALREAARALRSWRLVGCSLYVTLEPCPMCAGAIVLSRVARLVFGCRDPKGGAVRTLYELCEDPRLNHRVEVVEGVEAEACSRLLSEFFAGIRAGTIHKPGR
jgi:tRNA(adenine34) deaminase